jgi:hypothetical protein
MKNEAFIGRFSAWAPGISNAEEWRQWAQGSRSLGSGCESPEIAFTDPMFRRRLSQISKMTIQVVHDLLPAGEDTKIFFLSFRGEIAKQFKINKMVIEDNSLMPAAFSTSVFNAPVALASIAFALKGGYCAIYPGNGSFVAALDLAAAQLLTGDQDSLIFVYADEEIPAEYEGLHDLRENAEPLAFAFVLAKKGNIPLSSGSIKTDSPQDFLKSLFLEKQGGGGG